MRTDLTGIFTTELNITDTVLVNLLTLFLYQYGCGK